MELLLIDNVREHPCLYDIKSQFYRDHTMRQEAWEEIARETNLAVDAVKTTWGKLRNAFIAAKKRRQTKSGQAAKKIQDWKYEKEMSFLTPYLEMRDTQSNLEKRPREEVQEEDTENMEEESQRVIENMEEESQNDRESMEEPSQRANNENYNQESQWQSQRQVLNAKKTLPSSAQSRKNPNPAQEMLQIMKENAAMRAKRRHEESKTDLDETDMFYLSMAKTVKRLPTIEQAKIRMQLCELVSKAEIRALEKSSESCSISSLGTPPMTLARYMRPHDGHPQFSGSSSSPVSPPFPSPTIQPAAASQPSFALGSENVPYISDYQVQQLN